MTTIETITVREIIDPAGIGGNDAEWSETVRSATAGLTAGARSTQQEERRQ